MEYRNLQDNIRKEEYDERANGILNWIKNNREKEEMAKEPNAYEMTNLFLLGAKYIQEGENIEKSTLDEMWEIRSKDFEDVGVSKESFVYKICEDAYQATQKGKALVNDEASHCALRKMAGIGLYCDKQKRDGKNIEYNNPSELLELLEASRTLKGIHPELYEKYRFQANLEKLYELQPNNALKDRINEAMGKLDSHIEHSEKDDKDNYEIEK